MHPTLAVGLVIVTWLVAHNRSTGARVLVGVAALLLGWEPATGGSRVGHILLLIAAGIAASLIWDRLRGPTDRGDEQPLSQLPHAVDASASMCSVHQPPAPLLRPDEPMTEFDQADAYGDLLDANIEGLHDAQEAGDVRAQAAFAGEIAELATGMRSLLRVVVGDRRRLRS